MNILFTLCGRAGSKGFKNKNLKSFCGVPLVYYSIAAIKGFIDETCEKYNSSVVLNTDSKELIDIVQNQHTLEVEVIEREASLSGDIVPKVSVIYDSLCKISERMRIEYDLVVDLDITAPLRTIQDVKNAVECKIMRDDVNVVYSVTDSRRNPYFNMVKKEKEFFFKAIASNYTARQQAPTFYDMNASIYAYSADALRNEKHSTFFNDRCYAIIMKDTGVLDIDSEEDYQLMQVIAGWLFENDKRFNRIYKIAKEL